MITCLRSHLEARCRERGYAFEEVAACVVEDRGRWLVVDEHHEAYPRRLSGPGTELKALLARWGVTAKPNCTCNAKAKVMDAKGCNWCEANIETIVGWLRDEASRRKLPFMDAVGRALVSRAIRNARRSAGG